MALFLTVKASVSHVAPAAITECGPPSVAPDTNNPCQCVVVSSGNAFCTCMRTMSPLFITSVGPMIALGL